MSKNDALYINTSTGEVVSESIEDLLARGRVDDCDCGLIACACAQMRKHAAACKYRISVACPVGIECPHGFDVCPECDPCTCEAAS